MKAKDPGQVRLNHDNLVLMQAAAKADDRSLASIVNKTITAACQAGLVAGIKPAKK